MGVVILYRVVTLLRRRHLANDLREMREGADVDMGGKSILARGNKYIGLEARV